MNLDKVEILKVLEVFERLEFMSELERSRYIDDFFGSYPLVYESVRNFFNNSKRKRFSFYKTLKRKCKEDV